MGEPVQEENIPGFSEEGLDEPEIQASFESTTPENGNFEKVEKLENRITIVSVVVLCLVIAAVVYFYLEFSHKITIVQETGAGRVARLASQMQDDLLEVQKKISGQEKTDAGHDSKIESLALTTKNSLEDIKNQTKASLNKLEEQARADISAINKSLAEEKKFTKNELNRVKSAIDKDMADQNTDILKKISDLSISKSKIIENQKKIEDGLEQANRALADLIEWQMTIMERFSGLGTKMEELEAAKADRSLIESLDATQKKTMQDELQKNLESIKQRMAAMESQIVSFETELESLGKKLYKPEKSEKKSPGPQNVREEALKP